MAPWIETALLAARRMFRHQPPELAARKGFQQLREKLEIDTAWLGVSELHSFEFSQNPSESMPCTLSATSLTGQQGA